MIVSMIAAMGRNRIIGKNNKMMWHLPLEYKYFKNITVGHCIITGRKNFEAIGKPLPGRTNIIITRQKKLKIEGCIVLNSLQEAINYAKDLGETEVFITGGGQVYEEAIPIADKIYLTEVDFSFEQDGIDEVYFPKFDHKLYEKKFIKEERICEKNKFAWKAYVYIKIRDELCQ